jgi:hypothetical protein
MAEPVLRLARVQAEPAVFNPTQKERGAGVAERVQGRPLNRLFSLNARVIYSLNRGSLLRIAEPSTRAVIADAVTMT